MLDALYIKTIEKKDKINAFFDNIADKIDLEIVKENYVPYPFDTYQQNKNFAAIDGSFNKTKYMGGYVYAITSQTIISRPNENIIKESSASDLDIISTIHNARIDKILSTQMNIFELKSTIDTLKKHPDIDYMLMDGSLRGTLMNFQASPNIPDEIKTRLRAVYNQYEKELDKDEIDIDILTLKNEYSIGIDRVLDYVIEEKNLDIVKEDIEMDVRLYMESIEQLYCINYLLKHFKDKIICVSKTSSTKSVFKQFIPDSAVIEYTCKQSGYTHIPEHLTAKIIRVTNVGTQTFDYPVKNSELSENEFSIFFTKLEDKSNVLKIEIPRRFDDEKDVLPILNDLKSASIEGYPYILKKAHHEVKISNEYMDRINNKLEIFEKTGRDML